MKKQSRSNHRLALGKETIRTLDRHALSAAAGGDGTTVGIATRLCPSAACPSFTTENQ